MYVDIHQRAQSNKNKKERNLYYAKILNFYFFIINEFFKMDNTFWGMSAHQLIQKH